jgi:hypothetical protein
VGGVTFRCHAERGVTHRGGMGLSILRKRPAPQVYRPGHWRERPSHACCRADLRIGRMLMLQNASSYDGDATCLEGSRGWIACKHYAREGRIAYGKL